MSKVGIDRANELALEMGILLSIQQAQCGTNMLDSLTTQNIDDIIGYTMQGMTENEAMQLVFENKHLPNVHNKPSSPSDSLHHFELHEASETCVTRHHGSEFPHKNLTGASHNNMDKLALKWGSSSPTSVDHTHHKCDHTLCHGIIECKASHALHHGLGEFYHQSLEASSPPHPHILHHGLAFSNEVGLKCAHFNHHETWPAQLKRHKISPSPLPPQCRQQETSPNTGNKVPFECFFNELVSYYTVTKFDSTSC
jgi:hypothetical protein